MNKVHLIGRLTRNPEIRYSSGPDSVAIARYGLAVERRGHDAGADFINVIAFSKAAEFAEKYLTKGMKIAVSGRIQTGSYQNRAGVTVYTTDVVAEDQEFCESKNKAQEAPEPMPEDEQLPFGPVDCDEELPFGEVTR